MIPGVTDDKFDIDTLSTSKFLFYHFNNFRRNLGEEAYKERYTIVSDNQHALESLQSKDWSYFMNRLLDVSSGDIYSLNLSGISQNQNDIEELKIINDAVESLEICRNYYVYIYANVSGCLQNYLRSAHDVLIEKMQDELRLNLYSHIDSKNKPNTREILQTFDFFLCIW